MPERSPSDALLSAWSRHEAELRHWLAFRPPAGSEAGDLLQDVFLTSVRNSEVQVTMFLVNGVMLQGRVAAFDLFCMLLEREGYVQLAYKHAVSTIQPVTPVDLTGDGWDDTDQGDDD